jgi:3-oxoacyl-[acyl-carrier protein] reductase
MRLKDKVVIITGAGRGIGRDTAYLFAKEGAKVAVCDRDGAAASDVAAQIGSQNGVAMAFPVDVTVRRELDEMVEKVIAAWSRVDVLINNAGITQDATLAKMTEEQFDRVVSVNLKGVFNGAQAVLAQMVAQGKGKIINASSVVGLYGNFGQTNYVATKAGVVGMTKTWAKELGRKGITVNAVAPGFIMTEMTGAMPEKVLDLMREKSPLNRLGATDDIAKAYLYLASDDADFVTGHVLSVDGGLVV